MNSRNLYPFYTWNIFHIRPDKFLTEYRLVIHQIDDQIIKTDNNIIKMKNQFSHINMYHMQQKIIDFSIPTERKNTHHPSYKLMKNHFDFLFLKKFKSIKWELLKIKYDPIQYVKFKKVNKIISLGKFESEK